jgi:hypothetical protein
MKRTPDLGRRTPDFGLRTSKAITTKDTKEHKG